MFAAEQWWCWSADRLPESEGGASGAMWLVSFHYGNVTWYNVGNHRYIRCVRSRQQESSHARQKPERETKPKPPSQKTPKSPIIHLRSEPLTISKEEFREVFELDKGQRPLEYIQNDYEDRGEVVVDHATGLVWQKAGSAKRLTYKKAKEYVKELNRQKFAGYEGWRLPMIPELMSLLELEKESNDLYINPVFDSKQWWCWSADRLPAGERSLSESAWSVDFYNGLVYGRSLTSSDHVRCVRSRQ